MGEKCMFENFVKSMDEKRWVKNGMGENFVKSICEKVWVKTL